MNVPFVDLKQQYAPLKQQILSGMEKVLDGMQLFLGENVQGIEKEFAAFSGAEFGIGVSDGTTAIHLLLRAMGIGAGHEVITPSHTFIATVEAISQAGATPVFVDVDPETCLMDVSKVAALITPNTRAILPVHLYGQMVDMDPLMDIAKAHGLRVIEDSCQAHGAEYRGRKAGSIGDGGAFSFYFSKNLGAYGEGGFITTNDAEIARKVRMLRAKLPHLADWNDKRRAHAARYNELLAGLVEVPVERGYNRHVYHLYVIRTPHRDQLQAFLKERGIFTGVHYPVPIHLQHAVQALGYTAGSLPVTEKVASDILSLPMFAELTDEQIDYVVENIKQFITEKEPQLA